MKFARILFSILGLFILVCVLAITSLVYFVDPDKLKPIITAEVKKETGYQLLIDGKITWSFYPLLGIKIKHMTLTAPDQSAPFVDLSNVRMAMEFKQLLHRNKKLDGDVYIADAKMMNLHAQNAHAGVHWQQGALTLEPITATMYEGSLSGVAQGTELTLVPRWVWGVEVAKMQMKPFLQDISGRNGKLQVSGIGQLNVRGETQGNNREDILRNLQAVGGFRVDNGLIEGVDFNYLVQTADALMNRQALTAPQNFNQTNFSNLTGSFVIANGVTTINGLSLESSAFATKGKGSINLLSQVLRIELQINPQQNIKTQWEIPVLITGTTNNPNVHLDLSEVQKLVAKQELDKVKIKATEVIKKHIPGKAGDFLQNLIGN